MNIIFSRKGFDARAGGFPSLIFPDGSLFSIPIPSSSNHCYYSSLVFNYKGQPIQEILNQVTNGKINNDGKKSDCDYTMPIQGCHHDPMYIPALNRLVLGQAGGAESHLRNKGVNKDDIFLFYGWFKEIKQANGCWSYNGRDIHLIWSSMTVESWFNLDTPSGIKNALMCFPEINVHPHLASGWDFSPNGIYVSGQPPDKLLPYSTDRCLTDLRKYGGRSKWRLPICFNQPEAFSHLKNFTPEGEDVLVTYRGFGQEFVLNLDKVSDDCKEYILEYVKKLLQ